MTGSQSNWSFPSYERMRDYRMRVEDLIGSLGALIATWAMC